MRRRLAPLIVALPLALALAAGAAADPAGRDTTQETVLPGGGTGFVALGTGAGEDHVVRRGPGARPRAGRAGRRRSLLFFAQLTDPQIVDEMSPARVDFADEAGGEVKSSWRPQEALGTQTFDSVVRNVNANRRSQVRQRGGRRARLQLAITTGDLADNQQLNETRWFEQVLDGGRVDPFSGKPVSSANPCGGTEPDVIARLNDDVANRRYTGVADYDDYRDAPPERLEGFWDPDEAPPTGGGAYAAFPRYPGLNERAQRPFVAQGLKVPWLISRGNHDGLVQGTVAASEDLYRAIATGCLKVFPNAAFDPRTLRGKSDEELFASFGNPQFVGTLLAAAGRTAPDPDRRIIAKAEYKRLVGHGFANVDRAEDRRSKRTASYYDVSPRKGLRLVSIDTVAEGGGSTGNLDDPQYRWLDRVLRRAGRRGELVIVFGHHGLADMDNRRTDEQAGKCEPADEPGCDRDPRRSTPIHRGLKGPRTVRDLLLRHRAVIALVAGHSHADRVERFKRGRRAFWEIQTASHIDWPQQSRLIEVMDNRDGTLSLFGTILDSAAPVAPPPPGPAGAFSERDLASLSRVISFNDPQREGLEGSEGDAEKRGRPRDRNVELVLRDPRG